MTTFGDFSHLCTFLVIFVHYSVIGQQHQALLATFCADELVIKCTGKKKLQKDTQHAKRNFLPSRKKPQNRKKKSSKNAKKNARHLQTKNLASQRCNWCKLLFQGLPLSRAMKGIRLRWMWASFCLVCNLLNGSAPPERVVFFQNNAAVKFAWSRSATPSGLLSSRHPPSLPATSERLVSRGYPYTLRCVQGWASGLALGHSITGPPTAIIANAQKNIFCGWRGRAVLAREIFSCSDCTILPPFASTSKYLGTTSTNPLQWTPDNSLFTNAKMQRIQQMGERPNNRRTLT